MGLGIKKDFHMLDILFLHARQISPGEIVKILLNQQNPGSRVIDVKKRLQVGKLIRLS